MEYQLNNEITEEIARKKQFSKNQQEGVGQVFKPIVLENHKCPECGTVSGTSLELSHYLNCPNKFKKAVNK